MTQRSLPVRMVLDLTALREPGADRGLGRYARALREAAQQIPGYEVTPYEGAGARALFIARHGPRYHATSPYHLSALHLRSTVVSVQDVIPLELPGYTRTAIKARASFALARRCRVILASSEHSAARLVSVLGCAPEQIVRAPLPVALADGERACGSCRLPDLNRPYVTSVIDLTAVDPRKRLPWLLGAGAVLAAAGIPLILCGNGTDAIRADGVEGAGRLCDSHLRELLARARCFLYASAYEGQGLPPQEALAAGTPVVAFRNTSLPEMLGPGAAWVGEPADSWASLGSERASDPQARALADAALSLCRDEARREELAEAGRRHVSAFTADRFAAGVAAAWDRLG